MKSALIAKLAGSIKKTRVAQNQKWRLVESEQQIEIAKPKTICHQKKMVATILPNSKKPEIEIVFHGKSGIQEKLAIRDAIKNVAANSHVRLLTRKE